MSDPTTNPDLPHGESRAQILNALGAGLLIGGIVIGAAVTQRDNRYEDKIDAQQRGNLNTALDKLQQRIYTDRLAAGTVTVPVNGVMLTLHCATLRDQSRDCGNDLHYSKEAFETAVRANAASEIDRDSFATAYSDQLRTPMP